MMGSVVSETHGTRWVHLLWSFPAPCLQLSCTCSRSPSGPRVQVHATLLPHTAPWPVQLQSPPTFKDTVLPGTRLVCNQGIPGCLWCSSSGPLLHWPSGHSLTIFLSLFRCCLFSQALLSPPFEIALMPAQDFFHFLGLVFPQYLSPFGILWMLMFHFLSPIWV